MNNSEVDFKIWAQEVFVTWPLLEEKSLNFDENWFSNFCERFNLKFSDSENIMSVGLGRILKPWAFFEFFNRKLF